MKYQLIIFVVLLSLYPITYSQTIVSGNITGTWTPAGNPYIVAGDINVVNFLIIQPGVIVQFDGGGWEIRVGENAKLAARGTKNNPITFKARISQNPGTWDAIIFENSGTNDTLDYCVLLSAQDAIRVISCGNFSTNVTITNCIMYNNSQCGVRIEAPVGQALASLKNCYIYNNFGDGVFVGSVRSDACINYCTSTLARVKMIGCTIYKNALNGIRVQGDGAICGNGAQFIAQAYLWNCTITQNAGAGVNAIDSYLGGVANLSIQNSSINYNDNFGVVNNTQNNVSASSLSYDCFWGNIPGNFQNISAIGFGQNGNYINANGDSCDVNFNIYNNPLFVDTTSQDYRLQLCSKAIDAGTPIIDGQYILDPDGTYPDIGSHFFDHSDPVVPMFIADSTSFTFGNVSVDSSVTHEFMISNPGQLPLHITEFPTFPPSTITVTPPTAIIDTGSVQQLYVTFTPQTIGNINGLILAYHNARCVPDTFLVTGTGTGPNDVEQNQENPPSEYTLSQNYPNPFNPMTRIEYSVPTIAFVSIKVFDFLGREVKTLVAEEKAAGYYFVEFNAMNLTSGIYFYKMSAGSFTQTKKLLLLK